MTELSLLLEKRILIKEVQFCSAVEVQYSSIIVVEDSDGVGLAG